MTPQPLKIRADVELTCFAYDGVERIRDAMRAAEAASTEECPVRMKLVAPPLYVLTTQTLDKNKGVEVSGSSSSVGVPCCSMVVETEACNMPDIKQLRWQADAVEKGASQYVFICLVTNQPA